MTDASQGSQSCRVSRQFWMTCVVRKWLPVHRSANSGAGPSNCLRVVVMALGVF